MQGSRFQTVQLTQIIGTGEGQPPQIQKATAFAQAGALPLRVMIRNVSAGVTAFLSIDDVAPLNALPLGAGPVYQLPAGEVDVFVLAPKQRLIGAANAPGCFVCVAISEALPLDLGIGAGAPETTPEATAAAYPASAQIAFQTQPITYKKG